MDSPVDEEKSVGCVLEFEDHDVDISPDDGSITINLNADDVEDLSYALQACYVVEGDS